MVAYLNIWFVVIWQRIAETENLLQDLNLLLNQTDLLNFLCGLIFAVRKRHLVW